jgi:hypothetical protein
MDDKQIKQDLNYIFQDIFGVDNQFSEEELISKFGKNIPLPKKVKCAVSGRDTWIDPFVTFPVISQETQAERSKKDEWIVPKKPINSIDDILKYYKEINYMTGDKARNSKAVSSSDQIMESSNIYYSALIGSSKNLYYSYNNFNCNYLLTSRGNNSCTLGVRFFESIYCSSGFEVHYSNKVSRGYFISNCFDLFECMFCFNMASKKYCIANMQFEKDEYLRIKKMVIEWILKSFGK